jgi:hypothetical protein
MCQKKIKKDKDVNIIIIYLFQMPNYFGKIWRKTIYYRQEFLAFSWY